MAEEHVLLGTINELQSRLADALASKRAVEESIVITHVHGNRMANEVLGRLQIAKQNLSESSVVPSACGTRAELISQVDSIMKSIQLGNQLHANGCLLCW